MDKLRVPSPSNGFPFNNDDIKFILGMSPYDKGIYQAFEGILSAYGNNFIVSGCEVTGSDIAEGWVFLDGELIKVDAHTSTDDYFEKVVTYNSDGNKQTQTGGFEDAYQQNRATATASSGNLKNPATGDPDYFPDDYILSFTASETDKGLIRIADQATARAGTDNTEAMTSLRVLDAMQNSPVFHADETNRGTIRIADITTARAGTDNTEAMTTLRTLDALRNGTAFLAQPSYPGVVEKATTTETESGTANKYIDASLFQEHKTVNKDSVTIIQTGGNYSIVTAYDIFNFTSATPPDITMPDPTTMKNRVIILYSTAGVNLDINNTGPSGSQVDDFYPGMAGYPGSATLSGVFMAFLSDGYRWLCISWSTGVACPYVYINGNYVDEILKNQVGIKNYREEVINIKIDEGDNIIKLSEEKKETTFIDYLIISFDGKDCILFDERKILNFGDELVFKVKVPKHKKATLRAKGYYIND